jgi:hypothetical protein
MEREGSEERESAKGGIAEVNAAVGCERDAGEKGVSAGGSSGSKLQTGAKNRKIRRGVQEEEFGGKRRRQFRAYCQDLQADRSERVSVDEKRERK